MSLKIKLSCIVPGLNTATIRAEESFMLRICNFLMNLCTGHPLKFG